MSACSVSTAPAPSSADPSFSEIVGCCASGRLLPGRATLVCAVPATARANCFGVAGPVLLVFGGRRSSRGIFATFPCRAPRLPPARPGAESTRDPRVS
eukprot:2315080-Pleurochrysis_carterae.AAC.1